MDESACRIEADMAEDGKARYCIHGSRANAVRCMGGLILAAADFVGVSAEVLAAAALACIQDAALAEKTEVPPEAHEAIRKALEKMEGEDDG